MLRSNHLLKPREIIILQELDFLNIYIISITLLIHFHVIVPTYVRIYSLNIER